MPPLRTNPGRASKACDACRTRKTRCYESGTSSKTCLRCQTLGRECSLVTTGDDNRPSGELADGTDTDARPRESALEQRVASLEQTVKRLASLVARESTISQADDGAYEPSRSTTRVEKTIAAPLQVIRDAVPAHDPDSVRTESEPSINIIGKGLLSFREAENLLAIFQRHYGRWISLSETDTTVLRVRDVPDPLLLCVCCLIAMRHTDSLEINNSGALLFSEAKAMLASSLLHTQQGIAFFQASLVLSLWSSTAGQQPLSLDAWLITGFAVQQGSISEAFKACKNAYIWNHICLSHLHSCISMRRKTMIGISDVRKARDVLGSESSNNFEQRMVAELHLYWTLYEEYVAGALDLARAQASLRAWKQEWALLFDQPRHHFLQMGYSFARLLLFEQALGNRSAAVRESLISDMIHLCSDILQCAIDTVDDRTEHLTDHIYHMIAFAAITLSRLLHKYQSQVTLRPDIDAKHAIVLRTANILRSIGRPRHIGRTMGNIIMTSYQNLFPLQQVTPSAAYELDQDYEAAMALPDFLGFDGNFDWDALVPDWQSLASNEHV